MARGINKVTIVGHLGDAPEVKYLPNGNAVANFSVAVTESWKDKNTGQQQDKTEWIRVVVFGKIAEHCGAYLKKGSLVYVSGKLQTRKWQDQSGQDRYTTEVVVDMKGEVQFLDRKENSSQSSNQQQSNHQNNAEPAWDNW